MSARTRSLLLLHGVVVIFGFTGILGKLISIDAEHLSFGTDDLREDVANFASSGTEVENCFPLADIFGRVSTTVVAVDQLLGKDIEIFAVVSDRTAEGRLFLSGSGRIALLDRTVYEGFKVFLLHVTSIHAKVNLKVSDVSCRIKLAGGLF